MVQRMLGKDKSKKMHGMWFTTTTFPSDVHITYNYKRIIPSTEESPGELYALLHELSSTMGIWGSEEDEDLPFGDIDF